MRCLRKERTEPGQFISSEGAQASWPAASQRVEVTSEDLTSKQARNVPCLCPDRLSGVSRMVVAVPQGTVFSSLALTCSVPSAARQKHNSIYMESFPISWLMPKDQRHLGDQAATEDFQVMALNSGT